MSWDNDSGKEPQPASSSKQWAELTDAEKTAVVALGYSQLSWDYPWPAAAEKYFADLSAAEQAAAVELGYDATTWDNESGNEPRPVAWRTAFADLSEKEKNAVAKEIARIRTAGRSKSAEARKYCKFDLTGTCKYGNDCKFVHNARGGNK